MEDKEKQTSWGTLQGVCFFVSETLKLGAIIVCVCFKILQEVIMWGWILCVMLGLAVLVLGILFLILFRKNKALKQEIKKLLNDSRAMVDKEKRNPDDIYFHVDDNLNISFINDTACQYFKIDKNQWLNQPILGNIIENTPANLVYLNSTLNRLKRNPSTINETIAVKSPSGKMRVMKIRIRPILNEILNCVGMSIVLKDAEETKLLQDKLSQLKNRDTLSKGILNQDALFARVDKDFNRCKRYNLDFSLLVIELKDIYDFICKGIDFERGDKLFMECAELCKQVCFKGCYVGRFNKTKFAIVMPKISREQAAQTASNIYYPLIKLIQSLGIDKYNAEMFVVSYSNRKNFSDTADALFGRINAHIERALKRKDYGIKSSDKK